MSDAIKKPAHYNQGPIECIDAMKIVLTPEEFRGYLKGNVFKYLWREKDKNGIEDLRKGREYYDRLMQLFDESEQQPVIKQSSTTESPDGWRWLEVGEVIRRKDMFLKDGLWRNYDLSIGQKVCEDGTSIRRNRFEVGEKVVRVLNGVVYKVIRILSMGYQLESEFCAEVILHGKDLAPYIEEQS